MYKIGFIDDDFSLIENYQTRLKRKNIELLYVQNCTTKEDVLDWILSNEIKCMLIDYKLSALYSFDGTDLLTFLNRSFTDLPCVILTNYCEEGISQNLVVESLFVDREVLDADFDSVTFTNFVNSLNQMVHVFETRLKYRLGEYHELKRKKENGVISLSEEENMINLYKILKMFKEVDDIPSELLSSSLNQKMDNILKSLDELINKAG